MSDETFEIVCAGCGHTGSFPNPYWRAWVLAANANGWAWREDRSWDCPTCNKQDRLADLAVSNV